MWYKSNASVHMGEEFGRTHNIIVSEFQYEVAPASAWLFSRQHSLGELFTVLFSTQSRISAATKCISTSIHLLMLVMNVALSYHIAASLNKLIWISVTSTIIYRSRSSTHAPRLAPGLTAEQALLAETAAWRHQLLLSSMSPLSFITTIPSSPCWSLLFNPCPSLSFLLAAGSSTRCDIKLRQEMTTASSRPSQHVTPLKTAVDSMNASVLLCQHSDNNQTVFTICYCWSGWQRCCCRSGNTDCQMTIISTTISVRE